MLDTQLHTKKDFLKILGSPLNTTNRMNFFFAILHLINIEKTWFFFFENLDNVVHCVPISVKY